MYKLVKVDTPPEGLESISSFQMGLPISAFENVLTFAENFVKGETEIFFASPTIDLTAQIGLQDCLQNFSTSCLKEIKDNTVYYVLELKPKGLGVELTCTGYALLS